MIYIHTIKQYRHTISYYGVSKYFTGFFFRSDTNVGWTGFEPMPTTQYWVSVRKRLKPEAFSINGLSDISSI